jgi:hypothetical protein
MMTGTIDSFDEFRQLITYIRSFCERMGIPKSQWPKYDMTNWALISGILPGCDRQDLAVTCPMMREIFLKYNMDLSVKALNGIIHHMINKSEAILPHNRNIGQSCVHVLRSMGKVKFLELPPNKDGFVLKAYYFGEPHVKIIQARRAFPLIIKP